MQRTMLNSRLFDCIETGDTPGAIFCLDQGADPNCRNYDDQTPLHLAAQKGQVDVMAGLIESGADLNAIDFEGETPLHLAALADQPAAVLLLIKSGAAKDPRDHDGRTPLHHALLRTTPGQTIKAATLLVLAGADLSAADKNHWDGRTLAQRYGTLEPLIHAVQNAATIRYKRVCTTRIRRHGRPSKHARGCKQ